VENPGLRRDFFLSLAMQFVNPLFLLALGALIIPILIHLFNFRQFKKVYFTNVAFLREIQQETKKQSRLKQLLILLSRLLAIAALVLAFAQPYIPAPGQLRKNVGKKAVSIYLDNSFSMETMATDGKLIDLAKNKAAEIASAYAPSDLFQLMTNDFEGKMHRFTDRDQFLKLLEEIQVSPVTRNLTDVVARQNDLKKEAADAIMDGWIISDFQKSTHSLYGLKPDTSIQWFLVPLEASRIANIYIDSIFFESPVHQQGQTVRLHVRITNAGTEPLEKVPVKLVINGTQKTVSNFAVNPGATTEVIMPYTENPAGIQFGQVEITDYPLVHDDIFYFSYQVREAVPVLCISQSATNPYITALFSNDSTIHFTNTVVNQVAYSELFSHSLIILNGVDDISTGFSQELTRFVESGGHLVIFPPVKPSPTLNQFLSGLGTRGYLQVDTTRQRVSRINVLSPVYSDVFEKNTNGEIVLPDNLDLPVVNRHYRIVSSPDFMPETLLEMDNKFPFLLSLNAGKGKLYLFASSLESGWSNFPRHPVFVPTLYKMALLSNPVSPLYHFSGENVSLIVPGDSVSESVLFRIRQSGNNFEVIPGITRTDAGLTIQTHDQIRQAGFYQVYSGNTLVAGLAFNYNRLESRPECYKTAEIKEQISRQRNLSFNIMAEKNRPLARQIEQLNQGTPLWKWFILLTLLFLAFEIALIRHLKI
jgi:hypothetical protein